MSEPTPYKPTSDALADLDDPQDFHVSELVSDSAGAHSPFGDIEFPVPYQGLFYVHPTRAERPNLAGDN